MGVCFPIGGVIREEQISSALHLLSYHNALWSRRAACLCVCVRERACSMVMRGTPLDYCSSCSCPLSKPWNLPPNRTQRQMDPGDMMIGLCLGIY